MIDLIYNKQMYEEGFSEVRIIIDPIGEIPKNIFVVDRFRDNRDF